MSKIIRNENQRIAVLADVQNLYYTGKIHYSSRINFRALLDMACSNRILIRAIAYVIKADDKEVEFFDAVNNAGYEIKEKDIQTFADGSKKGDWDVGIAMDAIRLGEKVDSIILISGDGDYIPVVTYLQQRFGCLVEVIAFDISCSKALREIADDFTAIEDNKKDLLFKTRNSIGTGRAARRKPGTRSTPTRKGSGRNPGGSSGSSGRSSSGSSGGKKPEEKPSSLKRFLGLD